MKSKIWSYFKVLIFFSIGIALIWMSFKDFSDEQIEKLKQSFLQANYWWLLLSILLGVFSHLIRAYRWRMLARPLGYEPKLSNSFYAVMIGYLVNYGVPRLGEISRCTVLNKYEKIPFTKSFGTVVAERVLDIILFFLIFTVMLITQYDKISSYLETSIFPNINEKLKNLNENKILISILIMLLTSIAFLSFVFRKKIKGVFFIKIKNFVSGFSEGLMSVKNVKNKFSFIFQTVLIWFCYYLSMHVCFYCIPECTEFGLGIGITAFVFGSITVMITPGGIGAYPFALQKVLFLIYGVNEAVGASFGWLSWTTSFIAIVATGLLSLVLLAISNKDYKPVLPETEKLSMP
jgi:uncharacterized protein (TIRG00374 family)